MYLLLTASIVLAILFKTPQKGVWGARITLWAIMFWALWTILQIATFLV